MWSGKRIISVNGEIVHKASKFFDSGTSEHPFKIGSHNCKIIIRAVMGITYNFLVDGIPQQGQRFTSSQIMKTLPRWAWLFWLATTLVLVIGFSGIFAAARRSGFNSSKFLIFVVLSLIVDMSIWIISSNQNLSLWVRIPLCLIFTVIYAFIILYLGCSCLTVF